jgi:multidrug resistance protein
MKKSPLLIIFLTVFLDLIGFGIVLPLLPFYAGTFGANPFQVGLLFTSFSLMQFLFAPWWGRLSDRVGRRPIILLGLFGSAVSYLFFGLAHSLWLLFLSRIFAGICGANISTAQAYIADSTTAENRAKGMGLIGAAYGLGFIFGPAIGGILSQYGYRVPAFFASGLALANFLAAQFLLPESLKPGVRSESVHRGLNVRKIVASLQQPRLGLYMILFFLSTFAFANLEATFALMTERKFQLDATHNGYLFAYIGILITILQGGLLGRLVKRFGERQLVSSGLFSLFLSLSLLPFLPSVPWLLFCMLPLTFGHGVSNPSLASLISKSTTAGEQGAVLGISQSLASLARILGPAWGGLVFDKLGFQYPYLTGGFFLLLAFLLSLQIRRSPRLEQIQ